MYVFQYERIVVCLSEVMTVHVCVRIIMYEFKCSSWPARGAAVPAVLWDRCRMASRSLVGGEGK